MQGETLGPYRIDRPLGAGGMGTVWAATVTGPRGVLPEGSVVALKVVHPHLVENPGVLRRFLREAEIGRKVAHPNVVRTLAAEEGSGDGRLALVMEYVEGQTLRALLAELGTVPEDLCRHVGREVAKGLAAIHAAGAVHRDLKPENVLVTAGHDAVKVMDLGVAQLAAETTRLSASGEFVGSVNYAAPEQFGRRPGAEIPWSPAGFAPTTEEDRLDVDGRADLHALGVVLYELATGRHPFEARDFRTALRRILDEVPRPCGELNPQLSPFFEEVVRTLLEKDRAQRFASADEVARVLDEGEASEWWRVRSTAIRTATRRPLRRIRVPRESALYGRDGELATLRGLYERAKSGDGRVVLVEGEAGIGKTRLVDEFVGALAQGGEDVTYLFGSFPPGGAATAIGAFSTAWREHFGEENLTDALRTCLPETPRLVPAFAALLRGDAPPEGAEPLNRESLQALFIQATRRLAAERPTILLVDDLHLAPEEGRALFALLAVAVHGHRVLLVGTARPGLEEGWTADLERLGAARLELQRLGSRDLVRMLAEMLRSDPLAEDLAGRIALKSDGNPFFVSEILRGLRESGFLAREEDGTWASTRAIREIEVPANVAELVQARLTDLAEEDKDLLDVAACCGFEFDPLLVAGVLGVAQIPAMKRFARIERRHRLVRACGRRYVFDHHQVQDAIYRGMPELLREPYHAAIAEALEVRTGAPSAEPARLDGALCVDLASHFLRGARGARAVRYLDAALGHLEGTHRNEAALDLAERALAVPDLVAGPERCRLLLRKAVHLEVLGRVAEERVAIDEAVAGADASGDVELRARARHALGAHLAQASRNVEAEPVLREALDLARAAGDRGLEASGARTLGRTLRYLARYDEALPLYERSLAIARETGNRRAEAVAEGSLGGVAWLVGRFDEARVHFERHLAIGREIGSLREESSATGNLGVLAHSLGRFDEARAHFEHSGAVARQIGARRAEAVAVGNLGTVQRALGRLDEARECFERRLALAREMDHPQGVALALSNLGGIDRVTGDLRAARTAAAESLRISLATADARLESAVREEMSTLLAEEGDFDAAETALREALALRRRIGDRVGEAEALALLGAIEADRGRPEPALASLAEAAALGRDLGIAHVVATAACRRATLRAADAGAARQAYAAVEPRLGLEVRMQCRYLLWRALGNPADLAAAREHLDFLAAHVSAARRAPMLANVRLHREIAAAAAGATAGPDRREG